MSYYGGPEPLEMEVSWDRSHKITGKTEDSEGCNRKVGLVPILAGNSIHWRPVDLTSQPVAHDLSYSRTAPSRVATDRIPWLTSLCENPAQVACGVGYLAGSLLPAGSSVLKTR